MKNEYRKKDTEEFEDFSFNGCAFEHSPMLLYRGVLEFEDGSTITMMPERPFKGGWGIANSSNLSEAETLSVPFKIYIIYYSIMEDVFYGGEYDLSKTEIKEYWKNGIRSKLIIGMGPFGKIAIWLNGRNSQYLISEYLCYKIDQHMLEDESVIYLRKSRNSKSGNCKIQQSDIDDLMTQLQYRYLLRINGESDIDKLFNYKNLLVNDCRFDGSYYKFVGDNLLNYHIAGKPKNVKCEWNINKTCYTLFLWMNYDALSGLIDKFDGLYNKIKCDFIIDVDIKNESVKLFLTCQKLKISSGIPEQTYQFIMFKNEFELCRSNNYNKPHGAWIW